MVVFGTVHFLTCKRWSISTYSCHFSLRENKNKMKSLEKQYPEIGLFAGYPRPEIVPQIKIYLVTLIEGNIMMQSYE